MVAGGFSALAIYLVLSRACVSVSVCVLGVGVGGGGLMGMIKGFWGFEIRFLAITFWGLLFE